VPLNARRSDARSSSDASVSALLVLFAKYAFSPGPDTAPDQSLADDRKRGLHRRDPGSSRDAVSPSSSRTGSAGISQSQSDDCRLALTWPTSPNAPTRSFVTASDDPGLAGAARVCDRRQATGRRGVRPRTEGVLGEEHEQGGDARVGRGLASLRRAFSGTTPESAAFWMHLDLKKSLPTLYEAATRSSPP